MLRPIIRDWWEYQGRPTEGRVFPCPRGKRAGEGTKTSVSHAEALPRDLTRCFGLETFNAAKDQWKPTAGRVMTDRERDLLEETEFTKPGDFHSWRRAFKQALSEEGVGLKQEKAFSGATDLNAHSRYLWNTNKLQTIPEAALPKLGVSWQSATIQSANTSKVGTLGRTHCAFGAPSLALGP